MRTFTVYIASHSTEIARCLTRWLTHLGVHVNSTWHAEPKLDRTGETRDEAAKRTRVEVEDADGLVLVTTITTSSDKDRFWLAGLARGQGKPVWIYGPRETASLWDSSIPATDHMAELADWIRADLAIINPVDDDFV